MSVVESRRSLIAEIEAAIESGSAPRRVETLRRVTDLFMGRAQDYSDEQIELFDDVICRLAERIESWARAELAGRLAPVKNAPPTIVRTLARDEEIEVARPVLMHSPRLTDEDLLACAQGGRQDRLLAISKRASISGVVTDVLVTQGNSEVVRSVAQNRGARFSDDGYGKLVEKSIDDEVLAICVALRKDIPQRHLHALVAKASEAVFKKLVASNPGAVAEVQRVLTDITGCSPKAEIHVVRDYTRAKAMFEENVRAGKPIDDVAQEFAKSGKLEETVVVLSTLCHLPIEAVERAMIDKRGDDDLALILAKAAGLSWQTARHILGLRRGEGGLNAHAIETAYQHFYRLQLATAQRVVRFYQVRHAAADKSD
jgi:uncharacterized protein (DUF2336 family)